MLLDPLDNGVAKPLYSGQGYEASETAFVSRLLKPNMNVLDIGANVGYFTTLAAKLVGPAGLVIAVEPDADNYKLLRENISRNHFTNVKTVQCALGSHAGEATLFRSRWNLGDHRLTNDRSTSRDAAQVVLTTADELLAQMGIKHIDFVKIDVQGFECEVQRGMIKLLERIPGPTILTECWPYGIAIADGDAQHYFDGFVSRGYDPQMLLSNGECAATSWHDFVNSHPDYADKDFFTNLVFEPSQ